MTAQKFRELALKIPGAIEAEHMGHPDFRINQRIFATVGYPDESRAMVKLTPAQQKEAIKGAPEVFEPCSGAWGRAGSTSVHLAAARAPLLRAALKTAAANLQAARR
ncbi:MAG TPA: MmcQ/YjbR family DNA-binding protein [Verrucomicrobiae bacterium]|nr:MmcQ/YjbR family DNA-binding protein [Verrucomicrobiae bacterium]